jgi:diguanylate cyclase (GGDEF)-like protein
VNAEINPAKRILIADDDPVSRLMLTSFLTKCGYEVSAVADGNEALRMLESEQAPRLAILDWMMPGAEGVQVCQKIREHNDRPYIYVLLLTARSGRQDLLRGLELGADDYLTKPFDSQELHARIRVGERILNLQDDLLSAQKQLLFRATHDPLTGIPNRSTVVEALGAELNRQRRDGGTFGVVMVDIDHFKAVNDTKGHLCGDEVLQTVAGRISRCLREYDTVGRYGGEEFLIVAPGCDLSKVMNLAERIRTVISSDPVVTSLGEVSVSASLGAAVSDAREGCTPEKLLTRADEALYLAKDRGRNRVEMANSAPEKLQSARL